MSVHLHPESVVEDSGLSPGAEGLLRVVIADDHALMRHGLRLLLDDDQSVKVVAEAGDLPTAVRHVNSYRPHVLLIDLSMSNGSSMEAIRSLRAHVPSTQIVVLSMEDSTVFAQEILNAGAIGFVLKQAADGELAQAVRSAAGGQRYLSPSLAARLASRADPPTGTSSPGDQPIRAPR